MTEVIYQHPETYDLEHAGREPDIAFYLRLAERWRPTRLLELGCGSGRVTLPLAVKTAPLGIQITALDTAEDMLRAAREKARQAKAQAGLEGLRWVKGDMRQWRDSEPFDLILCPCGTMGHLTSLDDQLAAWGTTHANLRPGGRFVVEVPMAEFASYAESMQNPPRLILELDRDRSAPRAEESPRLLRYKATQYDAASQRASVRYLYDTFHRASDEVDRFLSDYESHVYYPRELELLFRSTGFQVECLWGNYREEPLDNTSPTMIMVGRKAPGN